MNLFWLRRRLRSEIQGLKYVLGNEKSKEIIKLSYVVYETVRIIYNPWYMLNIAKRNIISVI
tara:strand:+ start:462 stop:647 length:186 start_codon:yes stop_codon:yes gene_type:complete